MTYDFEHKHSLLDTNILRELIQPTKRSEQFRPVFEFLKAKDTEPFVLEATKFEFVGYSTSKKEYEKREELIGAFSLSPITPADTEMAKKLSSMYKCKNHSISPHQISYVDCLHAAQLVRLRERAFIVTTDVNDYPCFLFDTAHTIAVEEDGGTTIFVTFKTYNHEKWTALEACFNASA